MHQKGEGATGRTTREHVHNYKHQSQISNKDEEAMKCTKSNKENLTRKQLEVTEGQTIGGKPASKRSQTRKNFNSKISSGYGSMSSGSAHGEPATNKHSIFAQSTNIDSPIGNEKVNAIAGIYKSKVKLEDNRQTIGATAPESEHILTEKEANMYSHIKSAYKGTIEFERERRKETFFRKLQDVQIGAALQHNKELQEKSARKQLSKKRQLEQLAYIREKFEEDRLKRYKSQYVTKNFLNYEQKNRREYGLPEQYMKNTEYETKLKRTGGVKVTALDFIKREVKLKRNYTKMFVNSASAQRSATKDPKMEGKDQITIEVVDANGKLINIIY